MISPFSKQLFASLSRNAQEMGMRPVHLHTPDLDKSTVHHPVDSLSTKNYRRIRRFRDRQQKDDLLRSLARDIILKKRHKQRLEQTISSVNEKLDEYAITLDQFMDGKRSSGQRSDDGALSGSSSSTAKNTRRTTSRRRDADKRQTGSDSASTCSDKGGSKRARVSKRSGSSSGAIDELDVIKSRLHYLERKLELIRHSRGVDNEQYGELKGMIDRLQKKVRAKESA